MKVHLNQIPPEGKQFEGADPASMLDLKDPETQPVSPVAYTLDIGLSGGGLFATGQVGVTMELQCVKCLERFRQLIEVRDFACQVELTGPETVDLTEPVREEILLALPAHPHCDWNGERVCSGAFPALTAVAFTLPPAEPPAVWSALDQLKLNP